VSDRVTRHLVRGWRDNRSAWTRRVRWYEYRGDDGVSIRLNFCERVHPTDPRNRWIEVNRFYDNDDAAETDVFRFTQGERANVLRDEAT
jgi:hypothetical protein